MPRHIVALGGGGFAAEPDNPLLDDFILSLARRSRPKICFIPTASGDDADYVAKFLQSFPPERADASVLFLFDRTIDDLASFLLDQDIVFVGGGNTANMLAIWRVHGVDTALRAAYDNGTVVSGVSAGMLCWFSAAVTDSFQLGHADPLLDGLGWLAGSACPHYDGEAARRPRYHELVASGFPGGYAAQDFAAIHFVDEQFVEGVASRPGRTVFHVSADAGIAVETSLPTRYLG